jgi:outer membrane lipoprotein carrier protein
VRLAFWPLVTVFRGALVLFILCPPSEVGAANPSASLRKSYEKISDLQADFVQTLYFADFDTPSISRGQLFLKRGKVDGKIRWDYQKPERFQIFTDGETVQQYIPEHQQVLQSQIGSDAGAVAFRLLAGMKGLENDFQVTAVDDRTLQLIPKAKTTGFRQIDVIVAPFPAVDGEIIQSVTLHEENGNVTTFVFDQIRVNSGLKESIFKFSPPKGTEIITLP